MNPAARSALKSGFGREGGLDLVSGGPPCQSFSMAGLRRKTVTKTRYRGSLQVRWLTNRNWSYWKM